MNQTDSYPLEEVRDDLLLLAERTSPSVVYDALMSAVSTACENPLLTGEERSRVLDRARYLLKQLIIRYPIAILRVLADLEDSEDSGIDPAGAAATILSNLQSN